MTFNLSNIKPNRIYLILMLFTFLIYGNSINNEYSLDDNIVVDGNKLAEKGIRAIPEIFKSRYAIDNKQKYDYRPLVITSFAIEKQFFKKLTPFQTKEQKKRKDKLTQANVSHFVNVLLYALTCIVLFQVLSKIFDNYNFLLPFIITILYLVHPLHTEVVDNIKSRDEILMFLFMLISIKFFFKYGDTSKKKYLCIGFFFVLMSSLAKKNAVAIVGILPILMYFKSYHYKKILYSCLTLFLVYIFLTLMRKGLVSEKVIRNLKYFENPLIFEGGFMDRLTVGLYCSWFYLKMLIFPVDLSFYYGYNVIPMATFKNWEVWVAMLFYIPLAVYGIIQTYKRQVIGLGILLWLGTMLMVINVLFPIVGIVGDRFAYMFSLGFCVVIGYLMLKLFKVDLSKETIKVQLPNSFIALLVLVMVIYSGRTIARNPDWHDYLHLYTTDVEHLQESAKVHALISNTMYPDAIMLIRNNPKNPEIPKLIEKITYHFKESIRIDSSYATSLNNLGSVYLNFYRDYNKAIEYCSEAIKYDTNYVEANYNLAFSYKSLKKYDEAIYYALKTIEIDQDYLQGYNLINTILGESRRVNEGIDLLDSLAKEVSSPKKIYVTIGNLYTSKGESFYSESLDYFIMAYQLDESDSQLCSHILSLAKRISKTEVVEKFSLKCN